MNIQCKFCLDEVWLKFQYIYFFILKYVLVYQSGQNMRMKISEILIYLRFQGFYFKGNLFIQKLGDLKFLILFKQFIKGVYLIGDLSLNFVNY